MEPMRIDAFIFYTFILFVLNLRPFQNKRLLLLVYIKSGPKY